MLACACVQVRVSLSLLPFKNGNCFLECSCADVYILRKVASIVQVGGSSAGWTGEQSACVGVCVAFSDSWTSLNIANSGSVLVLQGTSVATAVKAKSSNQTERCVFLF